MAKKHPHLPKGMYFNHNAYYVVVKNKWIRLSDNMQDAFAMYSSMMNHITGKITTMHMLFDKYTAEVITKKSPRTQKDNLHGISLLRTFFGDMIPSEVKPTDVYAYMDIRAEKAKVRANRDKALLSHIFNHGIRWGSCTINPCANVKNFKEKPRDRLVLPEEVEAVKSIASSSMKSAIDLACITGLRRGDLLNLKRSQLTEEGIELTTSKTRKKTLIMYNARLLEAIKDAKKVSSRSIYLISQINGKPYTGDGFSTIWQKLIRKALRLGLIKERFTFHDLRAFAITNAYDKHGIESAQNLAGHTSSAITKRVYVRGTSKVYLPD